MASGPDVASARCAVDLVLLLSAAICKAACQCGSQKQHMHSEMVTASWRVLHCYHGQALVGS